jgi:hypothetical protein
MSPRSITDCWNVLFVLAASASACLICSSLNNISEQVIRDYGLAKLPLPEIAEDTKELTAEQIALKTPPEFVIGRLTEFNYQSSKDGTTVTMEYFTQEQVDAQVWANSK